MRPTTQSQWSSAFPPDAPAVSCYHKQAEDGATIFRQACVMGIEGIVSKRLSAPYRSGRSTEWLKIKNPNSPATIRAQEADW
jgi:bifunctional non-homologous end joining protein LigD